MVDFRIAALSVALLGLTQAEGMAVDCKSVRTSIEETICNSKWLLGRESALNDAERRLLARLDQREHDQLIDEQDRWSKGRDTKCANKPLQERETCIGVTTEERKETLQKRVSSLPPTKAMPDKPFEGHWESCQKWNGTDICSFYTLFQKGQRICGRWSSFATNAFYEGRLVWIVTDKAAVADYACGRPGGEISYWCPGMVSEGKTGWQKVQTQEVTYICTDEKGRYLRALEGSCAGKRTPYTKAWRALDAGQQATLKTDKWLEQCLNEPDYPPKESVVSRETQ